MLKWANYMPPIARSLALKLDFTEWDYPSTHLTSLGYSNKSLASQLDWTGRTPCCNAIIKSIILAKHSLSSIDRPTISFSSIPHLLRPGVCGQIDWHSRHPVCTKYVLVLCSSYSKRIITIIDYCSLLFIIGRRRSA